MWNPVLVLLMLAPHPSWLYVLVDFHLLTMRQYFAFGIHLLITYTLTLCAFASLILLVVRDPGSVTKPKSLHDADDDVELTEALMRSGDDIQHGSWCYKCEVGFQSLHSYVRISCLDRLLNRKEPTTAAYVIDAYWKWVCCYPLNLKNKNEDISFHRSPLSMVGFQMYCKAFFGLSYQEVDEHLGSPYIPCLHSLLNLCYSPFPVHWSRIWSGLDLCFEPPFRYCRSNRQIVVSEESITDDTRQNEDTPIHEVALTFAGIVFSLVVGSFLSYHFYLVS